MLSLLAVIGFDRYVLEEEVAVLGRPAIHLDGISRIRRDGQVIWEKAFLSGEDNMCHSLDNLEYHHFKYAQFLRPGDVFEVVISQIGTLSNPVADEA